MQLDRTDVTPRGMLRVGKFFRDGGRRGTVPDWGEFESGRYTAAGYRLQRGDTHLGDDSVDKIAAKAW